MKIKLQTTLKHKLQWLVLLAALLGVSHYVWGGTFTLRGSFNSWSNSAWIDNDIYVFLDKNTTYDFQLYGWSKYFKIKGSTHITGDVTDWWLHRDASNNVYIDTDTSSDGYYKFTRSGQSYWDDSWEYMKLSVKYTAGFKIKYPWYGESDWKWSADMTSTRNGNIFRCEGKYNGTSVDLGSTDDLKYNKTATTVGSPSNGNTCVFLVDAKGVGKTPADASVTIAKKVYSIIGYASDNTDFTAWHSMTASGSYYYFDCNQTGTFKFSDCAAYDAWFYKQFSNKTNSESGAVTITNQCSSDNNCTLGAPPSGYTYPIRVWIDPTNHKVWAVATVACSSAPVIGTQPQDTEVCKKGSASLTIAATITVGTPTYQWYTCNADGTGESLIGGATGSSYTLPTSTSGTYYYKCKASGCGETTPSRVATVTVDATSVAGSISALANPICSGTGTTLSIPSGNTGSITQWQYYNTASSQWTNLGTSAEQATGNLTAATQYKAYVKNGVCDAVPSSTYTVNLKTAPIKPSISGNEIMCGPSANGAYTYTSTDVSADSYSWTVTGATLYSGSGTRSITVTAGDVDDSPVTIAVTAVNCPNNTPLSTAADNFSARIFKSASAGSVDLTKSTVCVNESGITASRAGTWYSGGGTFQWSSSNTTSATVSSASATSPTITAKKPTPSSVNITCAINSPTCGSTTNNSAALTINGPEAFTIGASPASPKPWEVVTLSTSSSTSATWSITANPSGKAYLSTTSGTSTKLKAPYDASSYTVKASATSGGCTQENTKNVTVSSESCE